MNIRCILFDLDGTLIDTAPDIAYALNSLLAERNRAVLAYEKIRSVVSRGTSTIIKTGFPELHTDDKDFAQLYQRFQDIYRDNISRNSDLFPGMDTLLTHIEQQNDISWGVVTNKPSRLTQALMHNLKLTTRAACIISGDTTKKCKPHPEPMLQAARQARVPANTCVYIGDAQRDMEAGRTAGMYTIAACYGYLSADDNPDTWGADHQINMPGEIIDWLSVQQQAA